MIRKYFLKQNLFLEVNKDKKFEISQEVYDAALHELKKSFRFGEEMAMFMFFKKKNDVLYCNEFYDSDWIIKNFYGYPSPLKMKEKNGEEILGSFAFDIKKLYDLAKNKRLVVCHTHCRIATAKFELKPFCGAIIGFKSTSDNLEKLISETFYKEPKYGKLEIYGKPNDISNEEWQKFMKVAKKIKYRILFDFSDELYNKVLEECSPTIRLFYTEKVYTEKEKLKKIPLYLGEKCLS